MPCDAWSLEARAANDALSETIRAQTETIREQSETIREQSETIRELQGQPKQLQEAEPAASASAAEGVRKRMRSGHPIVRHRRRATASFGLNILAQTNK